MMPVDMFMNVQFATYSHLASFEPDDPGLLPSVEQEDEQVFALFQEDEETNE